MPLPEPGAAGVLIFIESSQVPRMQQHVDALNAMNKETTGRVTPEVLSLHLVTPTRDAIAELSAELAAKPEHAHLENIHKLRANNALRDLTAPWRLTPEFCAEYKLLVSIETVSPELRAKYPVPNLSLQAGKIEQGETSFDAALRELWEEARIRPAPYVVYPTPILLMSKGMHAFCVYITVDTKLEFRNGVLYIF